MTARSSVSTSGTNATEVIHIGQTVMGLNGTIDYLVDAVFNYPTLAESYKVAALDARNKLTAVERLVRWICSVKEERRGREAGARQLLGGVSRGSRSRERGQDRLDLLAEVLEGGR